MARNTQALVIAISMMFSNNLYECGPIDGYKFPVYTTPSCPNNEAEWLERSSVLNCTDQNGYMCIPNDMITVLVEFCYTKKVVHIPKGVCLILSKRSFAVDAHECHHFPYGCPSNSYFSDVIYKHQSCVSIVEGCFLADPYCERTVTANRRTTTSKYNTEEGISTNSITTGIPFPTFWRIIIVTIISSLIAGHCLILGITTIIKKISKTCGEQSSFNRNANPRPLTNRANDQTTELLMTNNIQDMPFEGPSAGGKESSLNRNSNQGPLMDRASNQTTELLIPDNIQDLSLEGPRAGGEKSSFNRNASPWPLTNRASHQTTELLIPNNIQDMPFEGPSAGSKESSLNQNSNPGPLTNHASVQTT